MLMISSILIILICDKLNDLRVFESAISVEALLTISTVIFKNIAKILQAYECKACFI